MRNYLRLLLFPLAVLSLFAGSAYQGEKFLIPRNQETPLPTFDPVRLAEPTLPANPRQADLGAQDYWLHCMVCHGDMGQGLTTEFRLLYPPEEQNCWQSGCHGKSPYADGFTLPTSIPAIIGPQAALNKFADASVLEAFIAAAMPWHKPASLDSEVYWRLTAYLLRQNGYENPYEDLGPGNAGFIPIGGSAAELETEDVGQATPHPTSALPADEEQAHLLGSDAWLWIVAAVVVIAGLALVWQRLRGKSL